MRLFLVAALLCAFVTSEAKEASKSVTVTPVASDDDAANNGLIYSLPTTALSIRIEAEMTVEKVGPYYKYSNRYLNLSEVITENKTSWKITGATIESYGQANTDLRYKVTADNAPLPAIALSDDGVLLGINVSPASSDPARPARPKKKDRAPSSDLSFDDIPLEHDIATKTSTAAMAEETANAIYRLRQKRLSLLGGEDAVVLNDEGSYKRVLAELKTLEDQYVSLFAGLRQTTKVTRTFTIVPDPNGLTNTVLVRFSETDGFLDVMDLNGKPVYVDLTFERQASLNELAASSKQRKAEPLTGLRYIVPGEVTVQILDRSTLLLSQVVKCSQNGQVVTLPASLLTNENVKIELNPANGALQSIAY